MMYDVVNILMMMFFAFVIATCAAAGVALILEKIYPND